MPKRNLAVVVAALAVLAIGLVLATSGSNSTVATSTQADRTSSIPVVTVAGGKPKGGVRDLTFKKGQTVRFKVDSDVADEIHVHGFDKHADVAAGGSVGFTFPASSDGKYEVELEKAGVQIASLVVQP